MRIHAPQSTGSCAGGEPFQNGQPGAIVKMDQKSGSGGCYYTPQNLTSNRPNEEVSHG